MPVIIHEQTGLPENETPAIYKTCWANSRMPFVYIAVKPDEIWFMPTEEAAAWAYTEHGGDLVNARVSIGNPSLGRVTRSMRFSMKGGNVSSLKDKKVFLDVSPNSSKNRSFMDKLRTDGPDALTPDERLICRALTASNSYSFSENI